MVSSWTGRHVKALRDTRRMSQTELARALQVSQKAVSNWEHEVNTPGYDGQLALDQLFGTLGHTERARFDVLLAEGDPVNRRDFLFTAAAATAAAASGGLTASSVSPAAINHLREGLHHNMMLDDSLGSNVAKPLIDATAQTCVALLRDCPPLLQPQLSGLAAEAVGSSAWAAWDQREYKVADNLFAQAFAHAEASGDTDIQAGVLLHRSDLAVETKRYSTAADFADAAFGVEARDPRLIDYRALRAAYAYSLTNRRAEARQMLRTVSGDFVEESTPDHTYVYWMSGWVTTYVTSHVHEQSGDRRSAVDAVQESLDQSPDAFTRHEAYSQLRLAQLVAPTDIERAADAARRVIELSRKNTSPRLFQKYKDTRDLLEPWADTRAIRELDSFAKSS